MTPEQHFISAAVADEDLTNGIPGHCGARIDRYRIFARRQERNP